MAVIVQIRPITLIDQPARRLQATAHNDHTWYVLPSREFVASSRSDLIAAICDTREADGFPGRVYSLNVAEGWSRDESEDVAREIANYYGREGFTPSYELRNWLHTILGCNTADEILGTEIQ